MKTIKGSCHCGAVEFELMDAPEWLTGCNCSICRRYAGLWAHSDSTKVRLKIEEGATLRYVWGDRMIAFHTCKTCGCTSHWSSLEPGEPQRLALNCRLAEPAAIEGIRVRHFDGAKSWTYIEPEEPT